MKFLFSFLLILAAFAATAQNIDTTGATRCQAFTLKQTQCTRTATMPDHRCKQHSANTVRCTGTTKAGNPCSRPASTGKTLCWQHDPTHPHNSKKHETGKR